MRSDRLLGVLALVLGITLFVVCSSFPGAASNRPGPAFLPRLLASLFSVCGLIFILRPAACSDDANPVAWPAWYRALSVVAGIVLFILVIEHVGYVVTATILTLVVFLLLENSWSTSVIATLVLVPGTYTLFSSVLGVVLPVGWFGW